MRLIIIFMALLGLPALALSATIVVPDDYTSIQAAINAATAGDTILVKPGTYTENINFFGKDVEVRSDMDVAVDTVDLATSVTVIDGGLNSSVFTFRNGETPACLVRGFTIKNGKGTWNAPTTEDQGGGAFIKNSSPTLSDNTFQQNSADVGGALYVDNSSALITENAFVFNNSNKSGGAIYCTNNARSVISHNSFTFNAGGAAGGAIDIRDFADPTVFNNIIKNNNADNGGAIECYSASPAIVNNIIKFNTAELGGAIYTYASAPEVTNNTIFSNTANVEGGGLYSFWFSFPILTNNILWDNDAPLGLEIGMDTASTPTVTYCDVDGGTGEPWFGAGCIDSDPLFLDPVTLVNLHLGVGSPCIDVGDNAALALPATDFNHEARIENTTVDMGADEFYAYSALELHVPSQYFNIQDAINAAPSGATIFVQNKFQNEGTYKGAIDFLGKDITVRSDKDANPLTQDLDPLNTTIDADGAGSAVTFASGEGSGSVLQGFTIVNGTGTPYINSVYGGGIFCIASSPTIIGNIISGNSCEYGAGIHCEDCSPIITNNTIENNAATQAGGGIMGVRCDALIAKNIIRWNTATASGGGIELFQYCNSDIQSNIIVNNTSEFGGGIAAYWSAPMVVNNTLSGNMGTFTGGGVYADLNSSLTIKNTILWNNASPTGSEVAIKGYSAAVLDFSNVDGGLAGVYAAPGCTLTYGFFGLEFNIVTDDPGFQDVANNNFKIGNSDSPCINRGTNDGAPADDIDGDIVPNNTLPDVGADEYMGDHSLVADVNTVSASGGGTVNLTLDAGLLSAGRSFFILGAATGTTPGTPLPGGAMLPLIWDGFTDVVMILVNSPIFSNFNAVLDGSGQGSAQLNISAGLIPPGNEGLTMYYAYTLMNPFGNPSNVIGVTVVP